MISEIPTNFKESAKLSHKNSDTSNGSIKYDQESLKNSSNPLELKVPKQQQQQEEAPKFQTRTEATINLFKHQEGYIGSGILALPYAFQKSGYLLATIVFLIISIIVYQTMDLLFQVADKYGKKGMTYEQIAQLIFGRKGMLAVKFFLVVFQFGCCISYIIFFLQFFEHVFDIKEGINYTHQLMQTILLS